MPKKAPEQTKFSVENIAPANPNDKRGPTMEWKLPENHQVTVCIRRAGSKSSHVHTGSDLSKNPERIFIARGKAKMRIRINGSVQKERFLREGDAINIGPGVWHELEILENDTVILEYRITHFDPARPDTLAVKF